MSFSKNFHELFITPEHISEEWDDTLFKYGELGDLKKLDKHLHSANEVYLNEKLIYTAIDTFTLKTETQKEKMRLLDNLKTEEFVEKVKVTKSSVLIKTDKGDIKACKLTDMIPEFKEIYPDLETRDRKGQCHRNSMLISNIINMSNNIVTGYIFGYSDKSKYLHSWIELVYDNEDLVIDYSLNALMNKSGYYQMQHAIPLNKISNKNIKEDRKLLDKFDKLGHFDIKEYLLYRDEIMNDLEKNNKIFNEER